jgi:hypothetical protein
MGDSRTGEAGVSTTAGTPVHRRSIANVCIVFPDANIPLGVVLRDTEFQKKIEFFQQSVAKYHLRTEILPKTNDEVTHRINESFKSFTSTLKRFRLEIEGSTKSTFSLLPVESQV